MGAWMDGASIESEKTHPYSTRPATTPFITHFIAGFHPFIRNS